MESNVYEQELFRAVKALAQIAQAAYWEHHKDCGSDMGSHCVDCKQFKACTASYILAEAIDKLTRWSC